LNFVGFSEKARNRREKSGLEKEREILFLLSLWKSRITPLGADVIGRQNKTFADPFSLYYHRIYSMTYISPSSICDAVYPLSVGTFVSPIVNFQFPKKFP
jgi:hypothetical protein